MDRLFRSNLAPRLLAYARGHGVDIAPLLSRHALPDDAADAPFASISHDGLEALANTVAAAVKDPFVGITLANTMQRGALGLLEFVSRTAPTARQAMKDAAQYAALLGGGATFNVEEGQPHSSFQQSVDGRPNALGMHGNEFVVMGFVRMTRELTGVAFNPARVWFAHSRPSSERGVLHHALGTTRMEFDAGSNGFAFPTSILDTALPTADGALHRVLEQQVRQVVASHNQPTGFLTDLKVCVRAGIEDGTLSLANAAGALQLSQRTLQRRLKEHGATFEGVVDDVRQHLARHHLANARMGVADVALKLGYSDETAFIRAFKRWVGVSPGEYRTRQRKA